MLKPQKENVGYTYSEENGYRKVYKKVRRGEVYYLDKLLNEEEPVDSEQSAGRPVVIVSNNIANAVAPIVSIIFLTTQPKTDLPTHVKLQSTKKPSTALCEQMFTVSKERLGALMCTLTKEELKEIDSKLCVALEITIPTLPTFPNVELEVLASDIELIKAAEAIKEQITALEKKYIELEHTKKLKGVVRVELRDVLDDATKDDIDKMTKGLIEKNKIGIANELKKLIGQTPAETSAKAPVTKKGTFYEKHVDQVMALRNKGMTVEEIAKILHIKNSQVSQTAYRYKMKQRKGE